MRARSQCARVGRWLIPVSTRRVVAQGNLHEIPDVTREGDRIKQHFHDFPEKTPQGSRIDICWQVSPGWNGGIIYGFLALHMTGAHVRRNVIQDAEGNERPPGVSLSTSAAKRDFAHQMLKG